MADNVKAFFLDHFFRLILDDVFGNIYRLLHRFLHLFPKVFKESIFERFILKHLDIHFVHLKLDHMALLVENGGERNGNVHLVVFTTLGDQLSLFHLQQTVIVGSLYRRDLSKLPTLSFRNYIGKFAGGTVKIFQSSDSDLIERFRFSFGNLLRGSIDQLVEIVGCSRNVRWSS